MELTSGAFFAVTVAALVLLAALLLAGWNRMPGPRAARVGGRVGLLLLNQGVAVLVALVWLNNTYSFYESWDDLLGNDANQVALGPEGGALPQGAVVPSGDAAAGPGGKAARSRLVFTAFKRDVLAARAVGPRSRLRGELYVWLPPQYRERSFRDQAFPVVELLPGQPGSPRSWFTGMDADRRLASLVGEQRVHPFILVAATMNYTGTTDTGCADLPDGPKVDTWLARDVPWLVEHNLRAASDSYHWAVMGFSAGGYCSVNLIAKHPRVFHAAVSLSGYNAPESPYIVHDAALRAANSPLLRLRGAERQPDIALLMAGSRQDGSTVADSRAMLSALRLPAHGTTLTVARGGHNTDVWKGMLPTAFEWLSRNTAGPVRRSAGTGRADPTVKHRPARHPHGSHTPAPSHSPDPSHSRTPSPTPAPSNAVERAAQTVRER